MNQNVSGIADLLAMISSVFLALVLSTNCIRKNKSQFRPVPLYFLFFSSAAICVHMAFHLFSTIYLSIERMFAGSFVYDFRFYSLNMMGVLLAVLSYNMLRQSYLYLNGVTESRKRFLVYCGWVVLVSAPTIPLTFIGSLPAQAVLVGLVAIRFVKKKGLATIPETGGALRTAEVAGVTVI